MLCVEFVDGVFFEMIGRLVVVLSGMLISCIDFVDG